jgi:hypothetical protein
LGGTATLISDGRHVYAVTARHVVRGRDSVVLLLPMADGSTKPAQVGGSTPYDFIFPADTTLDLALAIVSIPAGAAVTVFDSTAFAVPGELPPGTELRVVGHPASMSLPADVPIVKAGMVSVAPDTSGYYYIDSNVFPGNSGGAAILPPGLETSEPSVVAMSTRSVTPRLAGIITGYEAYRDEAISRQTGRVRVVFEENSGITRVVTPEALLGFLRERK